MKLTLHTVMDQAFASGIHTLCNDRGLDAHTAYKVGKIWNYLVQIAKAREDEVMAARKVVDDTTHESPAAAQKAKEELEAKHVAEAKEREVDFPFKKLPFEKVRHLTGHQLVALEPILEGVPDDV